MKRNNINMFAQLKGRALSVMAALFSMQNYGAHLIGTQNQYGQAPFYSNTSPGTAQRKRRQLARKTGR